MHQVKSKEGGEHCNLNPIFKCVSTNMCTVCLSTFASNICAKHHLGASYLQGRCMPGQNASDWPISARGCAPWHCSLCEFVGHDLAQLVQHQCSHLPTPLPVTNFVEHAGDFGWNRRDGGFRGNSCRKSGEERSGEHWGRGGRQRVERRAEAGQARYRVQEAHGLDWSKCCSLLHRAGETSKGLCWTLCSETRRTRW